MPVPLSFPVTHLSPQAGERGNDEVSITMREQSSYKNQPMLPTQWLSVLERLDQVLARTLAQTAEQDFRPPTDGTEPTKPTSAERLEEGLNTFQACLRRAERSAYEADAFLADSVRAIEEWLDAMSNLRQRLCDCELPSV